MRAKLLTTINYEGAAERGRIGVDPWYTFLQLAPFMVEQARTACEEEARSYRGFKVGAVLLANCPVTNTMATIVAANTKRENAPKICAERKVLKLAEALKFTHAVSIVVAATTNKKLIKDVTGVPTPTLHPCEPCRTLFDESKLVKPDTLIMTVGDQKDRFQLATVDELRLFYGAGHEERADMPPTHHYDDPDFASWFASRALYSYMTNNPNSVAQGQRAHTPVEAIRYAVTSSLQSH